jgi:alkyl hydroperoxide reductase subunit AhpF
VVVAGGGPAGVAAAVFSARRGVKEKMCQRTAILVAILAAICCSSAVAVGKPFEVYILAG